MELYQVTNYTVMSYFLFDGKGWCVFSTWRVLETTRSGPEVAQITV